jgi:hypothetical protein
MNVTRNIGFFWLLCALLPASLFAQEKPALRRDEARGLLLQFNASDNKLQKTIEVEKLNPYKQPELPAKLRSVSEKGFQMLAESYVSNQEQSGVAILHRVKVFNNSHEQLQEVGESVITFYDRNGDERAKFTLANDNADLPLVARNGDFGAVSFNGLVHDGETLKIGFTIFDLRSKKILHDVSTPDVAHAWASEDVFVFAVPETYQVGGRTYYVYDTRTGVLYKKWFDQSTVKYILRFENRGVILGVRSRSERVEEYQKEFIKAN